MGARVILLYGKQNEGKTTRLIELYHHVDNLKKNIAGFAAPGIWENGIKTGYRLLDLSKNTSLPLASISVDNKAIQFGRFYFNREGLEYGNILASSAINKYPNVFFIDEIGRFELGGNIWHDSFKLLTQTPGICIIATVRESFLDAVKQKFNLCKTHDFSLHTTDESISKSLTEFT